MTQFYRKDLRLRDDFKPETVFLSEGWDDVNFVDKVLQLNGGDVSKHVIFSFEGLGNLEAAVDAITKEDNFDVVSSFGVVLDANSTPDGRVTKVFEAFRRSGIVRRTKGLKGWSVNSRGGRKLGAWVTPGKGRKGAIEDLVLREIKSHSAYQCILDYKKCVRGKPKKRLTKKGQTQIFISTIKGDVRSVGIAFQRGIFDTSHVAYSEAVRWIVAMI